MEYERELQFLRDTLRKVHVSTTIVSPGDAVRNIVPAGIESAFGQLYPMDSPIHKVIGTVEAQTMYKIYDPLDFSYIYFILPDPEKTIILFIGPYVRQPLTSQHIMEIAEGNGISPKNQRYLEEYHSSMPLIAENSHLLTMISTFCELIWQSLSFAIVDTDSDWQMPVSPINESRNNDSFDDTLVNMVAMERRYSYENELMKAIELGQIHKENLLLSSFHESAFERRSADQLRNLKNYCIIMNTISRKAAERGGVHPMYLDRVSSSFAHKIEQLPTPQDSQPLMHDMFRSYCRLVRKHSMSDYSPVVQKAVMLIDSDLSANLSLSTLAENQNISAGYLSSVFRKETGKTVSEYIRERRIKHAAHLLTTTHLQVQTIALHCGIMDVQYFSKIFKKQTGKTPREYRESAK